MKHTAQLLLIRHASSDADGLLCGSYDAPLSREGRAQVKMFCDRPPTRERPDALYTSTLARAREVSLALAHAWRMTACLDDSLREIHCGKLEGMALSSIRQEYPEVWARNGAQDDDDFAWPGGESYRQFRARVLTGLDRIALRHPGQRIAVVTHSGVVSQVLGALKGRRPAVWEADRPEPLTGTEVTWANGAPAALVTFNDHNWY